MRQCEPKPLCVAVAKTEPFGTLACTCMDPEQEYSTGVDLYILKFMKMHYIYKPCTDVHPQLAQALGLVCSLFLTVSASASAPSLSAETVYAEFALQYLFWS